MATTTDPAEIAKFSALAAEWWNPRGPFGALHRLNPVRLQYIREVATRHFSSPVYGGGVERSETEGVSPADANARPLSHHAARADSSPVNGGAVGDALKSSKSKS